jgi:hypothetical protein
MSGTGGTRSSRSRAGSSNLSCVAALGAGGVLWLAGLPVVALCNPGCERALLVPRRDGISTAAREPAVRIALEWTT